MNGAVGGFKKGRKSSPGFAQAKQDQGRGQGHGGERINGHADRGALVSGGDNGDTCCKTAHYLSKVFF